MQAAARKRHTNSEPLGLSLKTTENWVQKGAIRKGSSRDAGGGTAGCFPGSPSVQLANDSWPDGAHKTPAIGTFSSINGLMPPLSSDHFGNDRFFVLIYFPLPITALGVVRIVFVPFSLNSPKVLSFSCYRGGKTGVATRREDGHVTPKNITTNCWIAHFHPSSSRFKNLL